MQQLNELEDFATPSLLTNHPPDSNWRIRISALVIILIGTLAYLNSFEGHFLFDDIAWVGTAQVRQLWPPWPALFEAHNMSRPLIGLSLAINYAISGTEIWSYHVFNLSIHLLAALALFGIVRRTLLCEGLRQRFGQHSTSLAMVVALIWMVHPLHTQSVTYIIQRCESLMGMFYLATLYCAIRSFYATRKRWWYSAAIAACAAGMLSKQVMVTAPLMVLLHDGLFLSGSWKEALQKRWRLYVGLAATWSLLIATTIASPVNVTAGFAVKTISSWDYLKSEFAVLVYYLRLAIWPDSLCFDYGWNKAETMSAIVPYAIVVIAMVMATVWALWRRQAIGFPGAWFFLILSLTSTIMPFEDLINEYRMYLPLAAVVALVVLLGYDAGRRLFAYLSWSEPQRKQVGRLVVLTLVTVAVASLSLLTLQRNVDYKNGVTMWTDVVNKRPANARGRNNLGQILLKQGLFEDALVHFSEACKQKPDFAIAQSNLGSTLLELGRLDEGKVHLVEALRIDPEFGQARYLMGRLLASQGELDEAISHFAHALRINSRDDKAYCELGLVLEKQGKIEQAIENYQLALQIDGELVPALCHLALLLATHTDAETRNTDEARRLAEKAVQLTNSQHSLSLYVLAATYAETGHFPEALEIAQKALSLALRNENKELAATIEAQLKLYREGQARRDHKSDLSTRASLSLR